VLITHLHILINSLWTHPKSCSRLILFYCWWNSSAPMIRSIKNNFFLSKILPLLSRWLHLHILIHSIWTPGLPSLSNPLRQIRLEVNFFSSKWSHRGICKVCVGLLVASRFLWEYGAEYKNQFMSYMNTQVVQYSFCPNNLQLIAEMKNHFDLWFILIIRYFNITWITTIKESKR